MHGLEDAHAAEDEQAGGRPLGGRAGEALDRACGDPATTRDDGGVSQRAVILLGSTGSIGTQAVDVIARNPDRFTVTGTERRGRRHPRPGPAGAPSSACRRSRSRTLPATGAAARGAARGRGAGRARGRRPSSPGAGRTWCSTGSRGASASARRSRRCAPAARWRSPTRSRSSSAAGSCTPHGSAPTRSCRSTPSTRRSSRRSRGGTHAEVRRAGPHGQRRPVPQLVARRRQGGVAATRRSRTRPGRWAPKSRSTPRR